MNTIGWAVKELHNGNKVRRSGWNGKGMFLILVPGSKVKVAEGRPLASCFPIGTEFEYAPHVDMWTAQGYLIPWLCSQADLLATDWELAE